MMNEIVQYFNTATCVRPPITGISDLQFSASRSLMETANEGKIGLLLSYCQAGKTGSVIGALAEFRDESIRAMKTWRVLYLLCTSDNTLNDQNNDRIIDAFGCVQHQEHFKVLHRSGAASSRGLNEIAAWVRGAERVVVVLDEIHIAPNDEGDLVKIFKALGIDVAKLSSEWECPHVRLMGASATGWLHTLYAVDNPTVWKPVWLAVPEDFMTFDHIITHFEPSTSLFQKGVGHPSQMLRDAVTHLFAVSREQGQSRVAIIRATGGRARALKDWFTRYYAGRIFYQEFSEDNKNIPELEKVLNRYCTKNQDLPGVFVVKAGFKMGFTSKHIECIAVQIEPPTSGNLPLAQSVGRYSYHPDSFYPHRVLNSAFRGWANLENETEISETYKDWSEGKFNKRMPGAPGTRISSGQEYVCVFEPGFATEDELEDWWNENFPGRPYAGTRRVGAVGIRHTAGVYITDYCDYALRGRARRLESDRGLDFRCRPTLSKYAKTWDQLMREKPEFLALPFRPMIVTMVKSRAERSIKEGVTYLKSPQAPMLPIDIPSVYNKHVDNSALDRAFFSTQVSLDI